jgi:Rps23 Pro-64 3,4-dihydroxylase Tpa1-like proline 4-hydroxylase
MLKDKIKIDPALDPRVLTKAFQSFGRLHIPGFLTEASAFHIHDVLTADSQWVCSTMGGGTVVDVPVEMLEALSGQAYSEFVARAHAEAANGFHYMYDTIRLIGPAATRAKELEAYTPLLDFLRGPAFLDFVCKLTGDTRPALVDAQATRYLPGHYLTQHDDLNPKYGRLYAYVLNLTPQWRADWGGLLNFIDEDGHVAEAYAPAFNALNIFRVPQPHSVGFVAPFARGARLSITGWIHDTTLARPF